jgi:hypothetical protein
LSDLKPPGVSSFAIITLTATTVKIAVSQFAGVTFTSLELLSHGGKMAV